MPDSSALDSAVVAALLADVPLRALLPGGVYVDEAPPGSTRFVVVTVLDAVDVPVFGIRGYEDVLYQVKAVALSTAGADIRAAAARIDVLLEDGRLTIPGYALMAIYREARIRETEVDEHDSSIRWFHRGGHYRLRASLLDDRGWVHGDWIAPGWIGDELLPLASPSVDWLAGDPSWLSPTWVQL